MWGQIWGQMIWGGGGAPVPAMATWGMALLAALLAAVAIRRLGSGSKGRPSRGLLVFILLLAVAVPITARALTLPFTFTNGTVADANQVNANFEAGRSAITNLQNPERFVAAVNGDSGLPGSTINNTFAATSTPAAITTPALSGGSYLLRWRAEIMRTNSGGGSRVLFRVLVNGTGFASSRLVSLENGSDTAMPADTDFTSAGEVVVLAGSQHVVVSGGTVLTMRLEYGIANNAVVNPVLRARRQEISLVRELP